MRYLGRVLIGFICIGAWGQGVQFRGGWSIAETIGSSSSIFVGDVVSGASHEEGRLVTVSARVKVLRVLGGELNPGDEVTLSWRFAVAPDSLEDVTKVPSVHAIWFARRNGEALEAMRCESIPTRMGGVFAAVPSTPLPAELQYPADAPRRTKVAHELGWQLATLAMGHGSGGPSSGSPGWLVAQDEILSLHQTLANLDPIATRDVYRYFSASPEPQVELLGIAGRAMKNDISAIFDLEKDYDRLATVDEGNLLPRALMSLNFTTNLEAAHALGRVALAQNADASVDAVFAFRIWMTGRREFLPYLMAMLGSPDPTARGAALFGVCQLVHRTPENEPYCFETFRVKDEEHEKEMAAVRYWRTWWEQNRAEIAKTVRLPQVVTPARYGGEPQDDPLSALLTLPTLVTSRMSATDRAVYRDLTTGTAKPAALREQLKQRLSPEGWSVVDAYLKERAQDPPLMRFQK